MAKLERTYTVPLRHGFEKKPAYKRAPKAVRVLRAFLARHMKADEVKIGPRLNEVLWARGIKRPPPRVKVTAIKEDGVVKAELFGHAYPEPAKETKKEGLKERLLGRKPEAKEAPAPEAKPEAPAPTLPSPAASQPTPTPSVAAPTPEPKTKPEPKAKAAPPGKPTKPLPKQAPAKAAPKPAAKKAPPKISKSKSAKSKK